MKSQFREIVDVCPVIAAVKDDAGLEKALASECAIIFVLYGDLLSIESIVAKIKAQKKVAMVHLDLITGLGTKEVSVEYLAEKVQADGIISTKPALIKKAREIGLYTVLRLFILDSMSFNNLPKQCELARPDCIEILPGVMPKIISRVKENEKVPLIAGGLISDKEDIYSALNAGARAISTTRCELWDV